MSESEAPQRGHQRFDCATQPEQALAAAESAIAAGECIVLPTDTVYGIGAAAFDAAAVQRLLDAKHRGRDMPPPVLIAEPSMLRSLATGLTGDALALARAFWPGPLTVVVVAHPDLELDLGDRTPWTRRSISWATRWRSTWTPGRPAAPSRPPSST